MFADRHDHRIVDIVHNKLLVNSTWVSMALAQTLTNSRPHPLASRSLSLSSPSPFLFLYLYLSPGPEPSLLLHPCLYCHPDLEFLLSLSLAPYLFPSRDPNPLLPSLLSPDRGLLSPLSLFPDTGSKPSLPSSPFL